MSLDFAGCYPGFPLHVPLIGNPFPNFHLLLAHSNHLQVLCHPTFPQSIVRILAISTLDVDATQRRSSPLSTTQRLRYSLHVSNSRLRPLIQHRCCYQDTFTRFPWAFRPINTPMVLPSFHNPAVKILAPRFQLTTSTIDTAKMLLSIYFHTLLLGFPAQTHTKEFASFPGRPLRPFNFNAAELLFLIFR